MITVQLADIRRDLPDPARARRHGESTDQASERLVMEARSVLTNLLHHDKHIMSDQMVNEAIALAEIVNNPAKLPLFRAAFMLKIKIGLNHSENC